MKKVIGVFVFMFAFNFVSDAQSLDGLLDKALSLQEKGDSKGLGDALGMISKGVEKEVGESGGDFKSGLLSQVGGLNKLIPLASKGMVKAGPLKKIINTIKLMLGANRLGNMLGGGGSLIGKAGALESSLGLMKGGSSVLGSNSGKLDGLIDGAMGNVRKLSGGGIAAKAADKALPGQLGGILSMAKGIL